RFKYEYTVAIQYYRYLIYPSAHFNEYMYLQMGKLIVKLFISQILVEKSYTFYLTITKLF
ncbi:hypothetical protein, partial [Staphylococcus aureus]|uniref:hypothetical protein n=1 Tax=Staphylococcus aureus TaxID=1280 RepID=UPI001BFCED80